MDSNCQKCGSPMEQGYVLDSLATTTKPETWMEGEKPKSVWAALSENNKRSFEVEVYRCADCGYLESYATTEKINQ